MKTCEMLDLQEVKQGTGYSLAMTRNAMNVEN